MTAWGRLAERERILVDDDFLNRMQLVQALTQRGHATIHAQDGEQALGCLGERGGAR